MNDLSGQDIGKYHLIEPIGQGGMAVVYKAFETRLERYVAIKIIRREAFGQESLLYKRACTGCPITASRVRP